MMIGLRSIKAPIFEYCFEEAFSPDGTHTPRSQTLQFMPMFSMGRRDTNQGLTDSFNSHCLTYLQLEVLPTVKRLHLTHGPSPIRYWPICTQCAMWPTTQRLPLLSCTHFMVRWSKTPVKSLKTSMPWEEFEHVIFEQAIVLASPPFLLFKTS